MKRTILTMATVLIMVAAAIAQPPGVGPEPRTDCCNVDNQVKEMTKALQLTPEQQKKATDIYTSLDKDQKKLMDQMKEKREKADKKFEKILTEDQKTRLAQFKHLKEKQMQKMEGPDERSGFKGGPAIRGNHPHMKGAPGEHPQFKGERGEHPHMKGAPGEHPDFKGAPGERGGHMRDGARMMKRHGDGKECPDCKEGKHECDKAKHPECDKAKGECKEGKHECDKGKECADCKEGKHECDKAKECADCKEGKHACKEGKKCAECEKGMKHECKEGKHECDKAKGECKEVKHECKKAKQKECEKGKATQPGSKSAPGKSVNAGWPPHKSGEKSKDL
ncbi:MAG: hypothetical protein IK092_05330 [Muribaculaceae bacterium]|nr:hypothetical protein [Muribaculaceae bacterium]